jgi:hypothetical protein
VRRRPWTSSYSRFGALRSMHREKLGMHSDARGRSRFSVQRLPFLASVSADLTKGLSSIALRSDYKMVCTYPLLTPAHSHCAPPPECKSLTVKTFVSRTRSASSGVGFAAVRGMPTRNSYLLMLVESPSAGPINRLGVATARIRTAIAHINNEVQRRVPVCGGEAGEVGDVRLIVQASAHIITALDESAGPRSAGRLATGALRSY